MTVYEIEALEELEGARRMCIQVPRPSDVFIDKVKQIASGLDTWMTVARVTKVTTCTE